MTTRDWRLPENRREAFQRSYTFSLETRTLPGMVYSMLPAVADIFDLDLDGRAWLAWLNGNTQNVVTSMLILEEAPRAVDWQDAVEFWNNNFKALEWDTDRRHQKNAFGKATEQWFNRLADSGETPAGVWSSTFPEKASQHAWDYAFGSPFMGRISAWSYMEFAKILLPFIPDVDGWYLKESSSRSHRNALCLLSGFDDAWSWDGENADIPFMLDLLPRLHDEAEDLLAEARVRNPDSPFVSRLTMESALCTFKSWHKPDRRYPGVYADMMYQRIRKAEVRMGRSLDFLWDVRKETLPAYLRLEDNPTDPGLSPVKQNYFRETGEIIHLHHMFDDMDETFFDEALRTGRFPVRKDPSWTL